ncbi:hypothetical protein M408DRAFT_26336 [Serendipita vermifera MAFF 305830]|uniref:NmrA-like domain-containing protein n=1 Tax=Serendipita vermifera MAFF 305830 TaxID=933852 RepID=A0A0C3B1C9_SERVB|nr:hypothetical protein M408DRAFT_26336 [Serendipita vermifera MAFF 305830]
MAFTNVAVIGAGGALGKVLVQELLASSQPKFTITVLARPSSSYTPPSENVKVAKQDLADHAGMVSTLRGIDAVIMTQGVDADLEATSRTIVEAAIEAGVKMVMPSDYGSKDTPMFIQVYTAKPKIRAFVEEKAKEGKITYTIIKNGPFTEMPLEGPFGIDAKAKKATLYGDPSRKFNTTSTLSIARAIIGVLRSPTQFANRVLYIHDTYTSQREMLDIVEEATGGAPFEITRVGTEEFGRACVEGLGRGEWTFANMIGAIQASIFGAEGAADWDENDDSVAVGLTRVDLRGELLKQLKRTV